MSVEAFVRAAGGVMGLAREGFGAGGAVVALDRRLAPPPAGPVTGSGTAVDAHDERSRLLGGQVASLGAHDVAADEQLAAALGGSAAGRARMDAVIAAAVGDVEALGLSTNTPAGRRALVEAIGRRLQETKAAVDDGGADAATHAAAADVTAAGYNGVGAAPAPAAGMPLMALPGMGGMPAGVGGGMPMSMLPTSALQALSNLWGTPTRTAAEADPTKLAGSAVGDTGDESRPGRASEKGLQKYTKLINRAISAAFPEITDIGGVRPDSLKWHPQGLALDVMIPNWDTPQGKALGDRVVNFLIANRQRLGVDHMIWRQHLIQPDGSSSLMENRGSPSDNHMNHVHVASIGGGY